LLKTLAVGLVGLLAAVLSVGIVGPPTYRWFKQKRFLGIARDHWEQRDYAGALFFLSQVLQENPRNDGAVELVGRIQLAQNRPTAIFWIAKWAELDPNDPHRLLTLGKLSLGRGDLKTARTCLGAARKLPGLSARDAAELESGLLVREGKWPEALALLQAQAREPNAPPGVRLNYANLLLLSPDPARQKEGVALLRDLASSPESAPSARRSLLLYALDHHEKDLASETAAALQLAGLRDAADVLLWAGAHLEIEGRLPASFQEEAGKVADRLPLALPEIASWLLSRKLADPALTLARRYLENKRYQPGVWPLYAKCLSSAGDWETIRTLFPNQNWGATDGWRLLYLIQSGRRETADGKLPPEAGRSLWFALQIALKQNPFQIFALDRLALSWDWGNDRIRLWRMLDAAKPLNEAFLRTELAQAQKERDTIALYGLSRQLLRLFPDDKAIRNNAATYGLLLNEDLAANTALAEATSKAHPEDNPLKSTYALALLRNGKPREALDQFSTFSEGELKRPDVAAYYTVALAANGKTAEAEAYRKLASPQDLLPEEQALLGQAPSSPDR
jgi:predicted Zn-dependent protease